MSPEVWDWLRWVNVALAGAVVVLLVAGAIIRWEHMPKRFQRISPWVILTYVILAYGSAEVATSSDYIDPGLRVGLLVLNLCGLLVALVWRIGDPDYSE
jgi:hypothetical protein